MKKDKDIQVIDIDLSNPFKNKIFTGSIVLAVVMGITIASTYSFASKYTLNFRSPFQNPIVIKERITEVIIKEVIKEAEVIEEKVREATKEAEVTFSPSNRLVAHTEQRPDVYAKIVEYFGDDSMVAGELISRESSLNPHAINPTSGACGLGQALPCGKMECSLDDVDCQLAWVKEYIDARYGDVQTALAFHDRNNWY